MLATTQSLAVLWVLSIFKTHMTCLNLSFFVVQGMVATMLATMQNSAVLSVAALHHAFTRLYLYGIGVRFSTNKLSV